MQPSSADAARTLLLIIGESGSGKTAALRHLSTAAGRRGLAVCGVLSPAVHSAASEGALLRVGYDVQDAAAVADSALCTPLCRLAVATAASAAAAPPLTAGRFAFLASGVAAGLALLSRALAAPRPADVLLVDEVGPLELRGEGWAPALDALASADAAGAAAPRAAVLAVRPACAEAVLQRWCRGSRRAVTLRLGGSGGDYDGEAALLALWGALQQQH